MQNTTRAASRATTQDIDIGRMRMVTPRHYGRSAAVILLGALGLALIWAFAHGDIDWATTGRYLLWPTILWGVVNTVWMSIACMAIGIIIGVACAVARDSANPVLRRVALGYAWFFRGTPIILQLLVWYNLALVFPTISLLGLWEWRTVDVMTPVVATLLGLGLNQGAYTSEVMRSGILAVDRGQYEAAKAIGMSSSLSLRRIVLPQAMRVVIPPLGNEFIALFKTTSLASVIGFGDLLHNAQEVYFTNTRVVELLMVAGFWYLILVSILSIAQAVLERRFSRGFTAGSTR